METSKPIVLLGLRGRTGKTGRFLAQELGIPYVSHLSHPVYLLIRWGNSVPAYATIEVPLASSLALASNKPQALAALSQAGVPVPEFTNWNGTKVKDFAPCFIRTRYHYGGRGLVYINGCGNQHYDNLNAITPSYITKEIDKIREYRVHAGEFEETQLLFAQEKVFIDGNNERTPPPPEEKVWNYKAGFRFWSRPPECVPPRVVELGVQAVRALELAFGAVDIIVASDGTPWVLEVNTAPGLTSTPSQEAYLNFLSEVVKRV